jgi:hypothetical protein
MCDDMLGNLAPAYMPFFKFRTPIKQLEAEVQLEQWMNLAELHILHAFQRSNFYQSLGEIFTDAGALGTGVMYMEEDTETGLVYFSVRHLKECFIAENRWGVVDTVFRRFMMTREQVVEQFPDVIDKEFSKKATDHPDVLVEVLHIVEPGDENNFRSVYMLTEEKMGKDLKFLDESFYDYFPYIVWRFRKNSEEVYGRSPAMDAIYDVEMLNFMAKSLAEAAHKAINPSLLAPESMRGQIKVNPGGISYGNAQALSQIKTLYGGALGQYPLGIDQYNRRVEIVKAHFRVNLNSYLYEGDSSQPERRTATEVRAREAQNTAIQCSVVARATREVFAPAISNMFKIELKAKRLPGFPPELAQLAGLPMEVEYTGPLAKKQEQYLRSSSVIDGTSAVFGIAQQIPQVVDNFDWDYISREAADANGMPKMAVMDQKVVQQIRDQRAKQQAQMQQQAMALEMAKVNPALSKAPEEGSPAKEMQKR